jgi:high affinity Mn2+ porin
VGSLRRHEALLVHTNPRAYSLVLGEGGRRLVLTAALVVACTSAALGADTGSLPAGPFPYLVGGQTTVVWQHLPDFRSPYAGARSLRPGPEDEVSHSYTLYTGVRPLPWLDVYVVPEMIRGGGIGSGLGLAGYTNGEVIRNPAAGMDPYLGRAFLRATVPLGEGRAETERDLLQIGGSLPTRRIVLTGGVLAAPDIFDTNRYANNTRTQFLNWSFINDTAWDFAADTRGYTRGGAIEWIEESWAVRLGAFQMPEVANGLDLDGDLLHSHGDQVEVELHPTGTAIVRAMAYQNHARMGDYRDALALARETAGVPDVTKTRRSARLKYGFTLNLEQPLTDDRDTGLFSRFGWNDGATETFAYTEADWTASVGAQVAGTWWRRHDDRAGVAVAANGLSDAHADYLAAGGLGFELGDGRLSYRPETIVESYYLLQVVSWLALTLDYQFIADPGHNAARGPVSVVSLRLHLQYLAGHG